MKTHDGYCLEGEPGAWVWVHPDGSRHGPGASPPRDRVPPPSSDLPCAGDSAADAGLEQVVIAKQPSLLDELGGAPAA